MEVQTINEFIDWINGHLLTLYQKHRYGISEEELETVEISLDFNKEYKDPMPSIYDQVKRDIDLSDLKNWYAPIEGVWLEERIESAFLGNEIKDKRDTIDMSRITFIPEDISCTLELASYGCYRMTALMVVGDVTVTIKDKPVTIAGIYHTTLTIGDQFIVRKPTLPIETLEWLNQEAMADLIGDLEKGMMGEGLQAFNDRVSMVLHDMGLIEGEAGFCIKDLYRKEDGRFHYEIWVKGPEQGQPNKSESSPICIVIG